MRSSRMHGQSVSMGKLLSPLIGVEILSFARVVKEVRYKEQLEKHYMDGLSYKSDLKNCSTANQTEST